MAHDPYTLARQEMRSVNAHEMLKKRSYCGVKKETGQFW